MKKASFVPNEMRASVEEHFLQLFSDNERSLDEIKKLAEFIAAMPGIESFRTPVPWDLELEGGQPLLGESENLKMAMSDIIGLIMRLMAVYDTNTKVTLSIDETRLNTAAPIIHFDQKILGA